MAAPQLTKTWNISPNLRRSYTSLADMMGWFLYQNKTKLLAAGWTIKFTCSYDGISTYTGPTNGADTTDRWTSVTAATGRGTATGANQSYAVLQNADGLQILLAFQGTSDDIGRISYSPGGLFTLNTPSTFQPTATDEVLFSTGNSLVNATTSQDRVMTIWTTTDTTQWSCFIARAGAIVNYIGVEKIVSYCGVNVFTVPYVGFRYTSGMAMANNPSAVGPFTPGGSISGTTPSSTGFLGMAARVFTNAASRIIRTGGGAINISHIADGFTRTFNDRFFNANYPALQGSKAAPCYRPFFGGEKVANLDGILGSPIDWWFCHTASGGTPAQTNFLPGYDVGDTVGVTPVRSNWFVSLGSEAVRPWRDVAPVLLMS